MDKADIEKISFLHQELEKNIDKYRRSKIKARIEEVKDGTFDTTIILEHLSEDEE